MELKPGESVAANVILDAYWPVIEKAKHVIQYYAGQADPRYYQRAGKPVPPEPRIMPDIIGELQIELRKAQRACPVKRVERTDANTN